MISGAWPDFKTKEEKPLHLTCCPRSLEKDTSRVSSLYPCDPQQTDQQDLWKVNLILSSQHQSVGLHLKHGFEL